MARLLTVMMALWLALAGLALAAPGCVGDNLLDSLPVDRRAAIAMAVDRVPYHQGLLWQAEKGDQRITLVGTYHFGDPRHVATLARVSAALAAADTLLVEAGPEEEARLTEALMHDPSLMVNAAGPTLPERLSDAEWETLSTAMAARGSPAMVTAKLRPWYVAMMLGVSPCMLQAMAETGETGGLDHMLIASAQQQDVPVQALEPWDTLFSLFGGLSPTEEEDMLRAALPAAEYADDYAVTLTEAYFSGDVWTIWEFGRFDAYANSGLSKAQVDAQMQLAQDRLMDQRNRAWIGPLARAAQKASMRGKGIVAGFGALHLPGENGVLRLLERAGWTVSPL